MLILGILISILAVAYIHGLKIQVQQPCNGNVLNVDYGSFQIALNVLQLTEVGDYEAQNFKLK